MASISNVVSYSIDQVVETTNNLDNFIRLGVLLVTGAPKLPCPGLPAPDGWLWVDLPFEQQEPETQILSECLCSLRLLIRKGYVRVTYTYLTFGIFALRIYQLASDNENIRPVKWFREKFLRYKKTHQVIKRLCLEKIKILISILDYTKEAWNLNTREKFIQYISLNKVLMFKYGKQENDNFNFNLRAVSNDSLNFHLDRLTKGLPYIHYSQDGNQNNQNSLKDKLLSVYSDLQSPKIDTSKLDIYQSENYHDIMNGEIPGFKSVLYNYQRRSLAKMIEKEAIIDEKYMPYVLKTDDNRFFDLRTMEPLLRPQKLNTPRGGILAENMGLGKTCICLALICLTKYQISELPNRKTSKRINCTAGSDTGANGRSLVDVCVRFINQNSIPWKQYYEYIPPHLINKLERTFGFFEKVSIKPVIHKTRGSVPITDDDAFHGRKLVKRFYFSSTTLVVIPDNLFHQWNLEVAKHVKDGFLKILLLPNVKSPLPDNPKDLLSNDAIFLSMSAFSRQSQNSDSILRKIYWKRLIIDEGHSMAKTTQAVMMANQLLVERMWAISGTPTSGMTNLHVEDDNQEYTATQAFDARQDLVKLGAIISNFLKIEPYASTPKLWTESIIKPMTENQFGIETQLREILQTVIVRHTIKDVESDIKLPALHHSPIFLKPSFFDKLSINLFIAVLATNAVTSERKDVDYMFHEKNKSDLRRLVTNLRKATFYWTGFSIKDVENLLNICVYTFNNRALDPNQLIDKDGKEKVYYSPDDVELLKRSIFISKIALSNLRWRTAGTIHEMGYYVSNLPNIITSNFSLMPYHHDVFVYGFPHLIALQKFYYKNRMIKTSKELKEKVKPITDSFWKGYWKSIGDGNSGVGLNKKATGSSKSTSKKRPVSNKEEYKNFVKEDVQLIGDSPDWADGFDPKLEEDLFFGIRSKIKRKWDDIVRQGELRKKLKISNVKSFKKSVSISTIGRTGETPTPKPTTTTPEPIENIGSNLRSAQIMGTSSAKLTYLTLKLLQNQLQGIKSIVFYEFENSAYYLTEFMDLIGMNYIMYSTYVKATDRSINLAKFDSWKTHGVDGVCLVMDIKLASHGLTITAATHVYFINPVWNRSVEAQAIKRAHRIGQINEVYVETLILENTIEEEMYTKRGDDDEKVELIDHTRMKDYILQFNFLRLFDDDFEGEYLPTSSKSELKNDISISGYDYEKLKTEDTMLPAVLGKWDENRGEIKWDLPLFTLNSMTALGVGESKVKNFDLNKNLEEAKASSDTARQSVTFLEKLKLKRQQKLSKNVRFN
ncbi:hypothetical protein DAMA08_033440 [Martiniozyma asiatica (nom. inval.)]|nr:hypothetical protein DAMA08_033440 [Martiniozyma asiatica]